MTVYPPPPQKNKITLERYTQCSTCTCIDKCLKIATFDFFAWALSMRECLLFLMCIEWNHSRWVITITWILPALPAFLLPLIYLIFKFHSQRTWNIIASGSVLSASFCKTFKAGSVYSMWKSIDKFLSL